MLGLYLFFNTYHQLAMLSVLFYVRDRAILTTKLQLQFERRDLAVVFFSFSPPFFSGEQTSLSQGHMGPNRTAAASPSCFMFLSL